MKKLEAVLSVNIINEQLSQGYRRITCPSCGNETFDDHFVCPHCGWEYDGITNKNQYSSCNKSTINEVNNSQ